MQRVCRRRSEEKGSADVCFLGMYNAQNDHCRSFCYLPTRYQIMKNARSSSNKNNDGVLFGIPREPNFRKSIFVGDLSVCAAESGGACLLQNGAVPYHSRGRSHPWPVTTNQSLRRPEDERVTLYESNYSGDGRHQLFILLA